MKKILFSLVAFSLILMPSIAFAQEEEYVEGDEQILILDQGETSDSEEKEEETRPDFISPDSPLYFLNDLFEEFDLFFTFNEEMKLEKIIRYGERKLNSMEQLEGEEVNQQVVERLEKRIEKLMQKAERYEEKYQEKAERIERIRERHLNVLDETLQRVPEGQSKESIQKVIDKTKERYDRKDAKDALKEERKIDRERPTPDSTDEGGEELE